MKSEDFDYLPIGVAEFDHDGQFLESNQLLLSLTQQAGFPLETGATYEMLLRAALHTSDHAPDQHDAFVQQRLTAFTTGTRDIFDLRADSRWAYRLHGAAAENNHWIVSVTDITAFIQAEIQQQQRFQGLEQQFAERVAQLAACNQELEALVYSVSHDLRAPLRAVDGFSRAVLEDYSSLLPEDGQDFLRLVMDNTQRMNQLINDLLVFSRLSQHEIRRQTVDLSAVVNEIIRDLQPALAGREVTFEVGDLPACEADLILIRRVLTNLLDNAVKFTRNQTHARIEVGSRVDNGVTVYYVKDNGVGFDMRYAGKLFGVFQRLHRVEEFEGTGIGLATVQRIIHWHGGRIWADAEVNHGATFAFTIGEHAPMP